jgi:hypothetical protein
MMMMMADNRQQTKGAAEIPGRLRAIVADCRRLNSLPSLLRGGHPGSTGEKLPHLIISVPFNCAPVAADGAKESHLCHQSRLV